MRSMLLPIALILSTITVAPSALCDQTAPPETVVRVAVVGFKPERENVSEPLTNAIASALSKKPGYKLVERGSLEKIVQELNLNESGLITLDRKEFGQIKSVDFLIYGSISTMESDAKEYKIDGQKITMRHTKLTVAVRKTDVRTGEMTVVQLDGTSSSDSLAGAYQDCVNDIAQKYAKQLGNVGPTIRPNVIDIDMENKVIRLDQGQKSNITVKDIFDIGYEVTRPSSDGKRTLTIFTVVGCCQVTEVEDDLAVAIVGEQGKDQLNRPIFRRKDNFLPAILEKSKKTPLVVRLAKRAT